MTEENNELLMKNHEILPTGAKPFSEVNVTMHDENGKQNQTEYGHRRGRGCRGRHFRPYGRGHGKPRNYNDRYNQSNRKNTSCQKWGNDLEKKIENGRNNNPMKSENECYRCGVKGHWYHTCRTSKHLVDNYQASKENTKNVVTNFIQQGEDSNQVPPLSAHSAHFDAFDFFEDPEGRINHLICDGSVQNY
ncbi:uncharacterized protein LOC142521942 [Primulina tabacum]|uniref:uncharacterized protein LOC142521942 n=1 Tax=Primulina tabacum TaxID=48773 RepID=UPI003F5961DE